MVELLPGDGAARARARRLKSMVRAKTGLRDMMAVPRPRTTSGMFGIFELCCVSSLVSGEEWIQW